jgi:hypothetical protein
MAYPVQSENLTKALEASDMLGGEFQEIFSAR